MSQDILVPCTKCNTINKMPRVYCLKCGARLDFDRSEQEFSKLYNSKHKIWTLSFAIHFAVAVVLLVILILILLPSSFSRETGNKEDSEVYMRKRAFLEAALTREISASQVIYEKEINAYLADLVVSQPPPNSMFSWRLLDAGVRFTDNRSVVFVKTGYGPLRLTGTLYTKPVDNRFVVTSAKAGNLVLPGALGRIYASLRSGIFSQMRLEARILRHLEGVMVSDGNVDLLLEGRDSPR